MVWQATKQAVAKQRWDYRWQPVPRKCKLDFCSSGICTTAHCYYFAEVIKLWNTVCFHCLNCLLFCDGFFDILGLHLTSQRPYWCTEQLPKKYLTSLLTKLEWNFGIVLNTNMSASSPECKSENNRVHASSPSIFWLYCVIWNIIMNERLVSREILLPPQ